MTNIKEIKFETIKEIYKTELFNLYPTIYQFDLWENNKHCITIYIQGLQSISCTMIHSCTDGKVSISVSTTETLDFEFGERWISAKVINRY
jgi:hypothetical protein